MWHMSQMVKTALRNYLVQNLSPPPPLAHQRMPWWHLHFDHGVQIIDITNPYDPIAVSNSYRWSGATLRHYPLQVLSPPPPSAHQRMPWWHLQSDNGVQIIDITNPSNPTYQQNYYRWSRQLYDTRLMHLYYHHHHWFINVCLGGIFEGDDGVQIINITNPYSQLQHHLLPMVQVAIHELDGASLLPLITIDSSTYA